MHRSSSLSSTTDTPRISAGEAAGNLALIMLGLIVIYCAIVGAVTTLIAMGVAA